MRTITCPRCGSPIPLRRAFQLSQKPFCARCGWNLERAQTAIARQNSAAKLVPIAVAVLFIFVGFSALRAKSPVVLLVPLLFGLVMFFVFWSNYSAGKAIAAAKLSINPALAQSQPIVDPAVQQLQALPRPRRVRFRVPSAVVFVLLTGLLFAIGGFVAAAYASPGTRSNFHLSGVLVVPIVFVVLILVPFFRDRGHQRLMQDGELAIGRVTYQENVQAGKSSYSRIGYEFTANSGQLIRDQAKDLTCSVFEDMSIPVFYDPADPNKNVTPCATYLKLSTDPF